MDETIERQQQQHQQILRDPSELEGALLAVDAVAIPYDDSAANAPLAYAYATVAPAGIATTTTTRAVLHSEQDLKGNDDDDDDDDFNDKGNDDDYLVDDAVVLPAAAYSTPNDDERERRITEQATRRGRMKAEQELEEIQRNNRKVKAINYFQAKQVEEANQKALIQNFKVNTGQTQTSHTIPVEKYVPGPPREVEPEMYPGTFGKEYATSEYDTKEYQAKEYETTEYKSVYEP